MQIREALIRLHVLAPAIRQGWVIPVPHLRIWKSKQESLRAQMRRDVVNLDLLQVLTSDFEIPPAQSDNIRGLSVMPGGGVVPQDHARSVIESPMIYFNSVLAVAGATESRFLPTADSDLMLLRQRVTDAGKLNRQIRDSLAVGSLKRVLVPVFDEATFETICSIRASEDSFNDWRDGVRELADGGYPIPANEMQEYESIMDERLAQHVLKIESSIEKTASLRGKINAVRPSKLDIGLAAAVWLLPPQASISKLGAGVLAPVLKAALNSFTTSRGSANSVVMKLQKRS
ncbi:hypothetical protein [Amycolatopsis balhimycina]|uniref:hypothetical protein n=1 Tax=Amycolatopsis balhimycina TaxID=208443 RepID=UPI000F79A2CF|nr:hypothetical protein [Amycolatopsis balhimycina]